MNRKLITAAATAVAVVALGACGSSTDTKPAAGEAVAGGAVDGQAVATRMIDAMTASKTVHMTSTSQGKPIGGGDIEFTNPVNMAMTTRATGDDMEVVQVKGDTYIKGVLDTTKWVKVDPKGAGSSMGDLSKTVDPRSLVSFMEGVTGKDLGTKQVDGVSTRNYSFDVPVSAFGKVMGAEALKTMQEGGNARITLEYAIGDDNLLRKFTTVTAASGQRVTSETTYSDWGKPVRIVAPPDAEVGPPPVRKP